MVPNSALERASLRSMQTMANRDTPFIDDEWYVVAFASELGASLLKRRILGRRLVLFRKSNGDPVALSDRCVHRSFPLSSGKLERDTIVCGYHGFRYDADGDCIEIPSQIGCPKGIAVRRYPLVERGPVIWGWFGAQDKANPDLIPDTHWLKQDTWASSEDYLHLPGNYVSLHENLLDLTHLSFVHSGSFGTPDYARAPFVTDFSNNRFAITRSVMPTRLPPVWAEPTGLRHDHAARIATSEFISPGLHVVKVKFFDVNLPEEGRAIFEIRTCHIPTPETHGSTHYFIVHSRDFSLEDASVTQFMRDQLLMAFREDVEALTTLEQTLADPDSSGFEVSVGSDAPAVAMRRYLYSRATGKQTA